MLYRREVWRANFLHGGVHLHVAGRPAPPYEIAKGQESGYKSGK